LTFSGARAVEPPPTIESALASGAVPLFCGPLWFLSWPQITKPVAPSSDADTLGIDAEARILDLEGIEWRGCHK
jgi:hypothetical protein